MATQLFTSTFNAALGYAVEHKVGVLCDGSLAVCDFDGSSGHLYQVTSPGSSPSATSIQTFGGTGGTNIVTSLYVLNNGSTSSDVWVVYAENSATTLLGVAHATYTASGSSWSWDNTGTSISLGSITNGFMVPAIIWTGTYLIVATRGGTANFTVCLTYTSTKSGASGWSALAELESEGGSSHYYPTLLHDGANGCSIIVYSIGGDTVNARVLPDSSTPANANWSASVALSGTVGVGAANITATLDTTNKNLHVAWVNTSASTNPNYVKSTYTTTSISAGTAFAITGGAGTAATSPSLALDSNGKAYLLWASAASGAASDISYATIVSPYGSGNLSSVTNLTGASANDNVFPSVPKDNPISLSFLPVVYMKSATSPYGVMLDTSIVLSATVTGAAHISETATLSANGSATGVSAAGIVGAGQLHVSGFETVTASAGIVGHGHINANSPTFSGSGPGDIVRSTGTQFANKSGNGYGTGDISGTEFDYAYTDVNGKGWAVGSNPWYGGMPLSAWYELNATLNTALPQKTTTTGNQMSLLTTQSGGWSHWENDIVSFQSSELVTFANTGNFTELAPVSTPFRAYLKAIGDTNDANGISWQSTVCIYPGDPGLMVFRFDMTNAGASKQADESDFQLIASLVGDNGANPVGVWNPNNAFYGNIGGTTTVGWPSSGTTVSATLDYTGITPNSNSGITLGVGAAIISPPTTAMHWPDYGLQMNESGPSSTVPTRIKFGLQYGVGSLYTIPANTTYTFYVLRALRYGLTAADMAAIAADFKFPGTPTVTTGTFTSFSIDERAYIFAAGANNTVKLTFDLTPAHVTVRYKPILKVTGWTGGAPYLQWGAITLVDGSDYRHYIDSGTNTLYLQLYFDIVPSGTSPALGQRQNATLNVLPTQIFSGADIQANFALHANGTAVHFVPAHIALSGSLTRAASAHLALQSSLTRTSSAHAALQSALTRPVTNHMALSVTLKRPVAAHTALLGTLTRPVSAHAALQSFFTHAVPAHVPLFGTVTRTVSAHVSASGLPARQVTTTIALRGNPVRTVSAALALRSALARPVTAATALQSTLTRAVVAHAHLIATPTRAVTAHLALAGIVTRGVSVHASILQQFSRSVATHVAITNSTFTRSANASLALRSIGVTRAVSTSAPLRASPIRSVTTSAALSGGLVRAVTAHSALQSALARPVNAHLALQSSFTRPVTAHSALQGTLTRTSIAHAALQSFFTRAVSAHLALQAASLQRTAPTHVALNAALVRPVPVHVPLAGVVIHAVSARMALSGGSARAVSASVAVQSVGLRRTVTAHSALFSALTRPVAAHIAIQNNPARQVQTHGALQANPARSVTLHLALFSSVTRTMSAHVAVQSARTRAVTLHVALQGGTFRPVQAGMALQASLTRNVTQRIALQSLLIRTVVAHTAVQSTLKRTTSAHTALLATPTRPASARMALQGTLRRQAISVVAISGVTLRVITVHISLSPTLSRSVLAWVAITYPIILAPALSVQAPGGTALSAQAPGADPNVLNVV